MFTGENTIHPIHILCIPLLMVSFQVLHLGFTLCGSLASCASAKCSSAETRNKKGDGKWKDGTESLKWMLGSLPTTNTVLEKAYLEDEFAFLSSLPWDR